MSDTPQAKIEPSAGEVTLIHLLAGRLYHCDHAATFETCPSCQFAVTELMRHTRHEGKTAQEWAALYAAAGHNTETALARASLSAATESRCRELEAERDALAAACSVALAWFGHNDQLDSLQPIRAQLKRALDGKTQGRSSRVTTEANG